MLWIGELFKHFDTHDDVFIDFEPLFISERPLFDTEIIDFAIVVQKLRYFKFESLLSVCFLIKIDTFDQMFETVIKQLLDRRYWPFFNTFITHKFVIGKP